MTATALLLIGTAAVVGLMLILWLLHFAARNASVVDPGWAGGLALIAILYAWLGGGYQTRSLILAIMVGFWGFRLSGFLLFTRVIGHPEEGRYVELRRKWKTNIGFKFLLFFQAQAILCVLLSFPFLAAARNTEPAISAIELAAIALFVLAVIGESIADAQLNAFKSNPANKGKTCQVGLWHYSRHPNYFFEWLIWVAYFLFGVSGPNGWVGLISPVVMLFFLFRVTGIPATEAQALRSRGDAYREYQRTTSVFVPWFRRA